MVEVNLKTGKIMVNVEGLHERNKWTEYKKPIDKNEVLRFLIEASKKSCVVGQSDWFGKDKVLVLDGIKYCTTIYEYEMKIIHPTLGYTTMRKHWRTFNRDTPELMEYVKNKNEIPEWAELGKENE